MRELEQRRHPLRLFGLRIFTVGLLVILVGLVRGVWDVYDKERETYVGRSGAEQELQNITDREMRLRVDIARLRSPEGVEESLRQQFDMAKEGEGVIVIVDRDHSARQEEGGINPSSVGGWKRLLPLAPWHLFAQ